MPDLTVGTAFLQIAPSFRGFADAVDAEAEDAGETAGETFGSAFSSEVARSTSGANVGPSDADSASKGESSGSAFADAFKARVTAALADLPDAKIGADATEADAAIDDIRARLEELSNKTVGVDISDQEALAAVDEIKADLDELAAKHPEIDVSTNGVDSSIAELEALQAEADAVNGKTVKLDADSSSVKEADTDTKDLGVTLDNVVEKALASGAAFTDSAGKLHSANGEYASAASLLRDVESAGGDADEALRNMADSAGGASGGLSGLAAGAASSFEGISPLVPAVSALVAALVPLGGLAAGGLAALPALLAGAGTGIGDLYLGFSGITTALSDYTSGQKKAGAATSSTANTAISAAETQRNAANSVQSAQEALTNASVNGDRQIQQAQESLANAQVSAANSVHSAQEQLVSSEQSLTEAEYTEQQAQQSLTQARVDATNALINYNDQLADGALNAQQDQINLQEAQAALVAGPAAGSGPDAQAQLVLNVQKAQQAIQDQGDQYVQLQQQAAAANAAGVEGSQQVLTAQHQLDQATQGVATAQQSVADNTTALAQAQQQAVQNVADATNAVAVAQTSAAQSTADAQRALTNALADQSDALQKIADGSGSAGSSVNQFAADMAGLSPAAQQFVNYVTQTLLPEFDLFKGAIQEAIVPGVLAGLQDMQPLFAALAPLFIESAQWIGQFVQQIGQFLGSATGSKEVFDIFQAGLGFFRDIEPAVLTLFEAIVGGASKTGPLLQTMGKDAAGLIDAFAKWITDGGFQGFLNWLQKNGPSLVKDVEDFVQGFGNLLLALEPLGKPLDDLLGAFAKFIVPGLVDGFRSAGQTISFAVEGITKAVKELTPWFTDSLPHAISVTSGAFTTGFQAVHDIVNTVWHSLDNDVLHPMEDFFTVDIPGALQTMSDFFTSIWNDIWNAVNTAVNAVWTAVDTALGWIETAWDTVWGAIKSFAKTVWDDIWTAVNTGANAIWTAVNTVLGWIENAWDTIWGAIKSFAKTVWDDIWSAIDTAANAVWTSVNTVLGWISTAWTGAWNAVSTFAKTIWDTIWGFVNTGANAVWTAVNTVLGWIETAWDTTWSRITTGFSTIWDTIKKAATDGVNGVIDIINGIIGGVNVVLNLIPGVPNIPTIPHIGAPASSSLPTFGLPQAFHSGGMVGSGGAPMSGPLSADERMIRVQVGEEVLTADDPRHAFNLGGGSLNNSNTFHEGGVVGLLDDVGGFISGLAGDALGALGGAIATTATPAIDAGEAAVASIAAPFGGLGRMLVVLTDYLGNSLKGFIGNLGTAVSSKQATSGSSGGVVVPNGPATGDMLTMFQDILQGIGAPVNSTTIQDLTAWQQQEGGWTNDPDQFNPFNTTLPAGGSHGTNSVNVQSYPTFAAGLAATIATIDQGNMSAIAAALRSSAPLGAFESAVNGSPWGTVFHQGGIVPKLYDNGGILEPGLTLAVNNTGHDEIVAPNLSALRPTSSNSADLASRLDRVIGLLSDAPERTGEMVGAVVGVHASDVAKSSFASYNFQRRAHGGKK